MKIFVGVTDYDWFHLHASKEQVDEVNFWRPSPTANFKVLKYGEPFLFKLHAPRNFIVGGGFFTKFIQLPVSLAWEAFGEGNGARTFAEMRGRIARYRAKGSGHMSAVGTHDDPVIGCILLDEPFFFEESDWIPIPPDFSLNIVQGKSYDVAEEVGKRLWRQVGERLERLQASVIDVGPATIAAAENARYGNPVTVRPRLGQGSFRVLVTDAYNRRCVMTAERTLPVLEAAHIRPYSLGGEHALTNGLLLRSDLHRLFDLGYMTVDPDEKKIIVSRRIREEYENGRHYYELHGQRIAAPNELHSTPSRENLIYHSEHIFRS
jgi:putative restriction endonuclease